MRIGLISDTHGKLRPEVFEVFEDVDLILHAGDIGPESILTELEAIAPVHAVLGNTDTFELRARAAEALEVDIGGSRIVVVHGHQFGSPSADRLVEAYPEANVIVYGHTHRQRIDEVDGRLIINPGAAGPARFNLKPCVAILTLGAGEPPRARHITLE